MKYTDRYLKNKKVVEMDMALKYMDSSRRLRKIDKEIIKNICIDR